MIEMKDLIKVLNEIEQSAKHESKWGENKQYFKGVLECVQEIKNIIFNGGNNGKAY